MSVSHQISFAQSVRDTALVGPPAPCPSTVPSAVYDPATELLASKFIVYALIDSRTNSVRYVGKSSDGLARPRRPSSYLRNSKTHCANWIRQLQAAGLIYSVAVLETQPTGANLCCRERWWKAFGDAWGCTLTNLTDGGEGTPGRVVSAATRTKMSAALRGRPLAAATRAKLSVAQRGRTLSLEVCTKIGVASRGHIVTPETRAKMSAVQRGRMRSQETRVKNSVATRAAWARPENRVRFAAAIRAGLDAINARRAPMTAAYWYRALLLDGVVDDDTRIYEIVVEIVGTTKAGPRSNVVWYRNELRRDGLLPKKVSK